MEIDDKLFGGRGWSTKGQWPYFQAFKFFSVPKLTSFPGYLQPDRGKNIPEEYTKEYSSTLVKRNLGMRLFHDK